MKLVGVDVANTSDGGGIEVHGDTNVFNLNDAAKAGSGIMRKALPLILAAATGGGVLALAPYALDWLNNKSKQPAAVVAQPNSNGGATVSVGGVAYTLGLEVKDSP